MVVPIREVANKHYSFFSVFSTNPTITSYPSKIEINSINDDKMRGHSASSSNGSSRNSSVLLNTSSRPYHERMEINNELPKVDSIDPIDSSQLSYTRIVKVDDSVSPATNKEMASNSQYVNNKIPAFKKKPKPHSNSNSTQIEGVNSTFSEHMSDNVVNIQIPYDANQAVNPESWDSNFNSILLHGSMEIWYQMSKISKNLSIIFSIKN